MWEFKLLLLPPKGLVLVAQKSKDPKEVLKVAAFEEAAVALEEARDVLEMTREILKETREELEEV